MAGRWLGGGCALALMLGGCGGRSATPETAMPTPRADWRTMATEADRTRLREWRTSWVAALASARAAGHGAEIARDPALFDPDRALPGAHPPPGDYRCRVVKLGARASGNLAYVAYPAFACRVTQEADIASIAKLTGSQRPVGLLLSDTPARDVFLGTLMLGDETKPLQYGQDSQRDMAGFVERIGERRWRLVLPAPAFESLMDVIELVPA